MSNSAFRTSQIFKTVFILENIAVSENVPEHGSNVLLTLHFYVIFSFKEIFLMFFHSMGKLKLLVHQESKRSIVSIWHSYSKFKIYIFKTLCFEHVLIFNPTIVSSCVVHQAHNFIFRANLPTSWLKEFFLLTYFLCKAQSKRNSPNFLLCYILHCREKEALIISQDLLLTAECL